MASKYATGTTVKTASSMEEIKQTLRRFGATGFAHAEDDTRVVIMFVIQKGTPDERRVRLNAWLPERNDERFTHVRVNQNATARRTPAQAEKLYQDEINRIWRSLATGIKAKLVFVDDEIETLEEAFWAHIITPRGTTIYEETQAAIAEAYRSNSMPPDLLPDLPKRRMIEGKS